MLTARFVKQAPSSKQDKPTVASQHSSGFDWRRRVTRRTLPKKGSASSAISTSSASSDTMKRVAMFFHRSSDDVTADSQPVRELRTATKYMNIVNNADSGDEEQENSWCALTPARRCFPAFVITHPYSAVAACNCLHRMAGVEVQPGVLLESECATLFSHRWMRPSDVEVLAHIAMQRHPARRRGRTGRTIVPPNAAGLRAARRIYVAGMAEWPHSNEVKLALARFLWCFCDDSVAANDCMKAVAHNSPSIDTQFFAFR